MAQVNIALEFFGIAVSFLLLLCCFFEKNPSSRQTNVFIAMLSVNIMVLLCDALTWIYADRPEYTVFLYALNFCVYSFGYVLTALFSYYLVSYIAPKAKISRLITPVIAGLSVIAVALVVVSLFNHMYFTFDNGIYVRGDLFWLSQAYPIVIIFIDMIIVLRYSKQLGVHDTLSLLTYGILPVVAMVIQIYVYGITLLYIATTLSLLIVYITIHLDQNRRMKQKEAELAQANISIMLSQIQPHFMYNSLTSIARLCDVDPQMAKQATIKFSRYLRGNIDSIKQNVPVPFDEELNHIKIYLSLEKMRFQEDLNIIYNIETTDFKVPSLTIQPIVENAVKYGACQKEDGGTVEISTTEKSDCFLITIADDGVGFDVDAVPDESRSHIGIENVRNRLAAVSNATMEIESVIGAGTTVTIRVPKGE